MENRIMRHASAILRESQGLRAAYHDLLNAFVFSDVMAADAVAFGAKLHDRIIELEGLLRLRSWPSDEHEYGSSVEEAAEHLRGKILEVIRLIDPDSGERSSRHQSGVGESGRVVVPGDSFVAAAAATQRFRDALTEDPGEREDRVSGLLCPAEDRLASALAEASDAATGVPERDRGDLGAGEPGASSTKGRGHVIVLVHGIRTFARWQAGVARVLEEINGATVIPLKYGYLDVFRFWCPILTRRGPINDIRREIQNIRAEHPHADISVIAHSFGTYAITEVLLDNPDLRLHRLVLAGSIVKRKFRWDFVRWRLGKVVINDYGSRDMWPALAKKITCGYGDTGRYGFGRGAHVVDREHDFGHGGFLNEDFVRTFWKPWFESGLFVGSGTEADEPNRGRSEGNLEREGHGPNASGLVVEVLSGTRTEHFGGVVVIARVSNRDDRPNSLAELQLVAMGTTVRPRKPPANMQVGHPPLDPLAPNSLRLEGWETRFGWWLFPLESAGYVRSARLVTTPLRGEPTSQEFAVAPAPTQHSDVDSSGAQCPHCGAQGRWNGVICMNCGRKSDPWD